MNEWTDGCIVFLIFFLEGEEGGKLGDGWWMEIYPRGLLMSICLSVYIYLSFCS